MLSDDLKALQGFVIPESYLSGNTNKDSGFIYLPYIQGIEQFNELV